MAERPGFQYSLCRVVLMVRTAHSRGDIDSNFQYSLCRVVLMVKKRTKTLCERRNFQYSLCRVVLMVLSGPTFFPASNSLSVLALSSRFDGQGGVVKMQENIILSVLALSSRFDGRCSLRYSAVPVLPFQYSLCRVVLMVGR